MAYGFLNWPFSSVCHLLSLVHQNLPSTSSQVFTALIRSEIICMDSLQLHHFRMIYRVSSVHVCTEAATLEDNVYGRLW